ncbi:baculoviral IAP repeat-containing protein 8-like [Paramacrobiotus metropolitanus]|uniref:baculoviral IAP repeat-containing protein 8-like n=1 Tax=Paramacrobiotus metropolitanus TaxID=2943436 RepID=UPI00244597E4|nr:baculoviral IAP repeat-containing protein 8-like [Paramacrobiotus metropolitanus]
MDGFASAFGPRGDPRYPAESVENRIETFRGCGGKITLEVAKEYAELGWYCTGIQHQIRCVYCCEIEGTCLTGIYRTPCKNPCFGKAVKDNFPQMWVECNGVRMDYDQDNIEYNHSPPNNPDCAKYNTMYARAFSFDDRPWPEEKKHLVYKLAEAGFYNCGLAVPGVSVCPDAVRCFYCYVFISGLPLDLEPWIEHARQSPACAYLMNVKGKRFINDVIRACKSPVTDIGIQGMTVLENKARLVGFSQDQIDAAKAKKKGRFYFWEELEEAVEFHNADFLEQKEFLHYATEVPVGDDARTVEQLKCKICLSRYANTLISPCKHLVMCGQCAKATLDRGSLCPYCRQPVEAVTSLYFT